MGHQREAIVNSRVGKVEGTANVTTARVDTDAASKKPSTLAQAKLTGDALLDGLRSRPGISAPPGIRAVSDAIHNRIALARFRAAYKQAGALESRAWNIKNLPYDRRQQEFESVLDDISHLPEDHRFGPLFALARQICDVRLPKEKQLSTLGRALPVADRMRAFERVFDQIVRLPDDEHDQLLAVLSGQIEGLPEARRLSAFERIANQIGRPSKTRDSLVKQLPYVDEGAAQAILARLDTKLQREV